MIIEHLQNRKANLISRLTEEIVGDKPPYAVSLLSFCLYFLAARIGVLFQADVTNIAIIWPAAGIAAFILTFLPITVWLPVCAAIMSANIFANIFGGHSIESSLNFAIINCCEPLIFASLIQKKFGTDIFKLSLKFVINVLTASFIAAIITAALGAFALDKSGVNFFKIWQSWFWTDFASIIIIVNSLSLFFSIEIIKQQKIALSKLLIGYAITWLLAILAGLQIFAVLSSQWPEVKYLVFLPATIMTMYYGKRIALTGLLITITSTTIICLYSYETTSIQNFETNVFSLQILLASLSVTISAVAALRNMLDQKSLSLEIANKSLENSNKLMNIRAKRHALALKSAKIGIWDWDISSDKLSWDSQMFQIYDKDPSDFSDNYLSWKNALFEKDVVKATKAVDMALKGTKEFDIKFRIKTPKTGTKTIHAVATVIRNSDGEPIRMIGANIDVTAIESSERRLIENNLLQAIIKSSAIMLVATDNRGKIVTFNKIAEELTGYKLETVVGKKKINILKDQKIIEIVDAKHRANEMLQESGDNFNESSTQQWFLKASNENLIPIDFRLSKLSGPDESHGGYLATISDLRARIEQENALEEKNLKISAAFEADFNAKLTVNADGLITFFNKTALTMFGYSSEEFMNLNVDQLVPDSLRKHHPSLRKEYLTAPKMRPIGKHKVLYGRKKSGELFPVEIGLCPFATSNDIEVIVYIEDISKRIEQNTKLKQALTELKRSNEELENFAFIASHDLQAPLRHISSFVELLKYKINQDDNEAKKWMEFIVSGTVNMKSLIDGLLDYSKLNGDKTQRSPVNTMEIVSEIKTQILTLHKDAQITTNTLPEIIGTESQIRQLLQNLIQNAIKFRHKDRHPIIKITGIENDSHYEFRVEDNGIGIESNTNTDVFQLFQRAHSGEHYLGSGIGLAICKKVVSLHGGEIFYKQNDDVGTTFVFTISKKDRIDAN